MTRAAVIAIGAVSPLGAGPDATEVTRIGQPAVVAVARDPEMVERGFARPFAARVPAQVLEAYRGDATDRASKLLDIATEELLSQLLRARPQVRSERVALVLGTSSGGMCTAERFFSQRARHEQPSSETARGATYFAPFERARSGLEQLGFSFVRSLQIVTACAASAWSLGVALRWIEQGSADVVLAGGYDALCTFVASGFESLRATSASAPAPFRLHRDGMALGEGAALVALVREQSTDPSPRFFVSGFGASTDAVHVTAPDRTGGGVARAARRALEDASVPARSITLVSAHCTSTPFNDAMESRAIRAVLGDADPIVHPFKAQIGHTLGAAGVLETLALARGVEAGVAPAAAGSGEMDPDAPVKLLAVAEPCVCQAALKISAAFGGANAALVVEHAASRSSRRARALRPVFLKAVAHVREIDVDAVASGSGQPADKIARLDELSLMLATAIAKLGRARVEGGGVLVGHSLATIDINERFYARVLSKGPTAAEPRLFPPTSPNVMPGQVAILFGLTGPSAALASGPGGALDPLRLGAELVAAGDADRMLIGAVDRLGPTSRVVLDSAFDGAPSVRDGAVVALLESEPDEALMELRFAPRLGFATDALVEGACFGHDSLADALAELVRSTTSA